MDKYDEMAAIAGRAGGLQPKQWPGLAHVLRVLGREERAAERSACLRLAAEYGGRAAEEIAELIGERAFADAPIPTLSKEDHT